MDLSISVPEIIKSADRFEGTENVKDILKRQKADALAKRANQKKALADQYDRDVVNTYEETLDAQGELEDELLQKSTHEKNEIGQKYYRLLAQAEQKAIASTEQQFNKAIETWNKNGTVIRFNLQIVPGMKIDMASFDPEQFRQDVLNKVQSVAVNDDSGELLDYEGEVNQFVDSYFIEPFRQIEQLLDKEIAELKKQQDIQLETIDKKYKELKKQQLKNIQTVSEQNREVLFRQFEKDLEDVNKNYKNNFEKEFKKTLKRLSKKTGKLIKVGNIYRTVNKAIDDLRDLTAAGGKGSYTGFGRIPNELLDNIDRRTEIKDKEGRGSISKKPKIPEQKLQGADRNFYRLIEDQVREYRRENPEQRNTEELWNKAVEIWNESLKIDMPSKTYSTKQWCQLIFDKLLDYHPYNRNSSEIQKKMRSISYTLINNIPVEALEWRKGISPTQTKEELTPVAVKLYQQYASALVRSIGREYFPNQWNNMSDAHRRGIVLKRLESIVTSGQTSPFRTNDEKQRNKVARIRNAFLQHITKPSSLVFKKIYDVTNDYFAS